MTIIAILLAFALRHFVPELGRFSQDRWLRRWVDAANDMLSSLPGWSGATGFLLIIALPLVLLLLVNQVLISLLGSVGAFVLAIAVLIACFGPRDLDTEVAAIVEEEDPEQRQEAVEELAGGPVPDDVEAGRAAAVESVFQAALRRWFGVILWFAVLGIAGAFVYRFVDWLVETDCPLADEQRDLFRRMRQVMDWPAAQLMTLSLAIATDFDSVFQAWKSFHDEQGHGLFEGDNGFLLAAARSVVFSGHAARDGYADQLDGPMRGVQQAMDLTWRMLGVWVTVLAILLLVGVIV
ncbi:MAG: cobalamin biosynthesis protein [Gammaproteobacteria bacterium]|nr:cobalamin biosynthesis protein [Gammaproteobacteria bacterium]